MGDMADYYIDLALDRGEHYFSRYSRGSTRARQRGRGYTEPANPPPTCNRCGKTDLKWKWSMERNAWQLFEIDAPHAATSAEHQCTPITADDFDDCSDLV